MDDLCQLWELPEVILLRIVTFVDAPTHRASILCHKVAVLCKASQASLQEDSRIWQLLLSEDYGRVQNENLRSSKRLKRSALMKVHDAHKLLSDYTEIAFHYVYESMRTNKLEYSRFVGILDEYGPHLRYNRPVSSGGVFLVEVCRAKNATERTVLKCVTALLQRGSLPNVMTQESESSQQTALCVAAVRGMKTVVDLLLSKQADPTIRCSGRFHTHGQGRKLVKGRDVTALEFCRIMLEAEQQSGCPKSALNRLNACIKLLENNEA